MVYPYLELHILFYSNGLAIWSGSPDITHIKKIMSDNILSAMTWFLSESCQISNSSELLVQDYISPGAPALN